MKTKASGFTVIELIITLAITVMVLGVAYTFFFSNSKTLSTTEIKLQLQTEAEELEKLLINLGTHANGINSIDGQLADHVSNKYNSLPQGSNEKDKYKRDVKEIRLTYDDGKKAVFKINNSNLTVSIEDENGQIIDDIGVISRNIEEFKIRPLDVRMVENLEVATYKDAPGLEFDITLSKKKGYSDVEYNVSTIVKFRNK